MIDLQEMILMCNQLNCAEAIAILIMTAKCDGDRR